MNTKRLSLPTRDASPKTFHALRMGDFVLYMSGIALCLGNWMSPCAGIYAIRTQPLQGATRMPPYKLSETKGIVRHPGCFVPAGLSMTMG